eukprot:gnl/MRDRNA2_/MRDRNA2_112007_c0_seq1.p1 gnl/MRDRNA2_/MRDRNA2_112007_c0~~gnl/MRDRNA2_/MRDRNA2_112007_c0_seq1.p1  ORF type:complete len:947 (-),score=207.94 gnl/MRDRNA2_/MRDRNA2_112007_c0_seq1:91-2931(-)
MQISRLVGSLRRQSSTPITLLRIGRVPEHFTAPFLLAKQRRQSTASLEVLRVGGVPEHFNAPFHLAKQRGLYEKAGFDMQWTMYPGGTGAMATALEKGEVDIAIMLSEGAVAKAASGSPIRLCGTYVASPLIWGVHVKQGCGLKSKEELKGKIFGISRMGSGSHLMAAVMGNDFGWDVTKDVPLHIVGSLDGARQGMAAGEMDAWLWEKFTTHHLVASGEWDIIGEVPTPWPCFMFVASQAALAKLSDPIRKLIEITRGVSEEFKENRGNATVRYVAENHKLSEADARTWLDGTSWACNAEVAPSALDKINVALTQIGQVPGGWKWTEDQVLATSVCQLREAQEMPDGMYSWRVQAFKNWIEAHKEKHGTAPTMKDLAAAGHLDQYHYLGLEANDEAIQLLSLSASDHMLDVGSGIGGPARYISWKSGCKVTGLELQEDLVTMGNEVTKMVGLADKVHLSTCDAADLTDKDIYDVVCSFLVILHIPEAPRQRMFHKLHDAMKDDGRLLIEDMICVSPTGVFSPKSEKDLRDVVGAAFVPNVERYRAALESAGFVDLEFEDISSKWAPWAQERYVQFKETKEKQIAMHGKELFEQRLEFYEVVGNLFASGELGGARITGRKASPAEAALKKARLEMASHKSAEGDSTEVKVGIVEGGEAKRQKVAQASGQMKAEMGSQPPWQVFCAHDSLQYHFYADGLFVSLRLFRTNSLRRAWAFAAVRDASGNWVKKDLFSAEPLADWQVSEDTLDVAVGNLLVKDAKGGGVITVGGLQLKFEEQAVLKWDVPGQEEVVIHRPDMKCTIEWPGHLSAPVNADGYCKRYFGEYPQYCAWYFIQGFVGQQPIWTADAYFGDSKYNYFKMLDRSTGTVLTGTKDKSYHQKLFAYTELDGKKAVLEAKPLCEEHRQSFRSTAMDCEMYEVPVELVLDDGKGGIIKGFGLHERCRGTLR